MSYLLDTNSYIQAKNTHYRMGFCPGFWDWLDSAFDAGKISSVSLVYRELIDFGDELSSWAKERPDHFLPVEDSNTQDAYEQITRFVMSLPLSRRTEKARFLDGADPWLIAKASVTGQTVVTHEVLVPATSQKIKIPNICRQFNVPYVSAFDLLDTLKARFVLGVQD
ncbi:DUF4411 family protein [Pseudomonas fluorescens]|uniref:DUF4411 family protein n=1 Tax=Pseudomonas fluorescens TaxID=294 RepID=UPI0035253980